MNRVWISCALVGCGAPAADTEIVDTDGSTPSSVDTDVDLTEDSGTCWDRALQVEVGGGITAYVPLATGDGVVMVHGPQGGWHIDAGARVLNTHATVRLTGRVLRGPLAREQSIVNRSA